ncbi:MAG: FAD-dependent oxidoreductase [Gammaproteobacteria bacterium]|nr:FAD-dependent oxidoreductase [Gammaproteobacteria bacterium]MDH3417247.1 FAD-dependent oxidoreductase [Gammaproteobacteria bacterium]
MTETIAIVGAGHAAGQAIATLIQKKFDGRIVLIGDEPYLPYQRPPLSKKYLAGELATERLYVKPAAFYDDAQIELRLNTHVCNIDRGARQLTTNDDGEVAYDKLILALGSRVRKLQVKGSELEGIHYLRGIADVDAIRAAASTGERVVIVGAGYIGLEVAAVCRQRGLDVTVIEMAERVMSRVVSSEVSDFYQKTHNSHGVKLMLSTGLSSFHGNGKVHSVMTSDGQTLAADFVVIGVGILPNVELAESAGLEVNDGIVVDDQCRTSDSNIYAVGDCTSHPNAIYDMQLRLESVHNALEQAKTAASNICGVEKHYSQVPWFWSDQYELKLQIAGLSQGYDRAILRGDPESESFSCLYLKDGILIAVDAINAPKDFLQSKVLIAERARIDPQLLANADVALKDLS